MPAGYRLRVDGHQGDHWSPWFGDLTLTQEDDGTTSLGGAVADQAGAARAARSVKGKDFIHQLNLY